MPFEEDSDPEDNGEPEPADLADYAVYALIAVASYLFGVLTVTVICLLSK